MSGFLLLLGMGAVAWYAWPAAPDWKIKFWTGFLAVFLCPFSWPWLIARGVRIRKARRLAEGARLAVEVVEKHREVERVRQENIAWWKNERLLAVRSDDRDRAWLANETLNAMGYFDGFTVTRNDGSHRNV